MSNNTEYELRVLEVDTTKLIEKLEKLGAKKIGEYNFRRHVFESVPPVSGRWVRLRSNGSETTLTVKQIENDEVDGTIEWETRVDDFDEALKILEKIGLSSKGYQENRRIEYELQGVQVCIDSWPKIPAYLEIEGKSKEEVLDTAMKLGFGKKDITGINTEKIYLKYGIDISKKADLTF